MLACVCRVCTFAAGASNKPAHVFGSALFFVGIRLVKKNHFSR